MVSVQAQEWEACAKAKGRALQEANERAKAAEKRLHREDAKAVAAARCVQEEKELGYFFKCKAARLKA